MVKGLNDEGKNLIKGVIENNRILKLIIIEKEVKIMEEVREKIVEVRRFFDLNNIFYVMIGFDVLLFLVVFLVKFFFLLFEFFVKFCIVLL